MVKYTEELRPHRTEFKYDSRVFYLNTETLILLPVFSSDLSRQIFPKKLASGYFNQVQSATITVLLNFSSFFRNVSK